MAKYRVGMIGVGNISKAHFTMLQAMPDRVELVGLCDVNPEQLKARSEEWQLPAYSDLDELITQGLDVAWVMTPPGPRRAILERCFAAGLHVFTEKPLALNVEDAEACTRAAKKAGKVLGVGFNMRNEPTCHLMGKLFFDGGLGRMVKVYSHQYVQRDDAHWAAKFERPDAWRLSFEQSGGRITEFAVHAVNWVQWIGGEPRRVFGVNDAVSPTLATHGLDDVVCATIGFDQGYGIVEVTMNPGCLQRRLFGIVGTKGEVFNEGRSVRVVVPAENRNELLEPPPCPNRAESFLDALDAGKPPLNDGEAGLAATKICVAFNESVASHQAMAV